MLLLKTFHICYLFLLWALSHFVDLCWEFYHALKIKVTYTPPNICYASTLEVSKNMPFHLQQKNTPCLLAWFFSIIIINEAWAIVFKKKKKNVDTWRSIKNVRTHFGLELCKKKLALLSNKGWRKNHCYGVIMLIPFPHTCTPWSECMIFFSMDPLFDLAIYAMQVCFTLILPNLHISLLDVGRKAKHHCLGEDTNTI